MIEHTKLDTKKPVGNGVSAPEFAGGETTLISTKSADMSGGDSSMMSASEENLAAKWKNGAQDVPEAGKNQYE